MSEARRNTDRNRSPNEIERELEEERAKMRETVDRLSRRFTGEYAWEQAGRYLRENRGSIGSSAGRMLREKPFAVVLTAIGISWMLFGPKSAAASRAKETSQPRRDGRTPLSDRSSAPEADHPVPAPLPETRSIPATAGRTPVADTRSEGGDTSKPAPAALTETTPYTRPSGDGLPSATSEMDAASKGTPTAAPAEDRESPDVNKPAGPVSQASSSETTLAGSTGKVPGDDMPTTPSAAQSSRPAPRATETAKPGASGTTTAGAEQGGPFKKS